AVERRQLTVMFCDLVGSTELASRLDPEDLREVIAGYQRAVADAIAGFDGFIAKYMGDGVLAYFGYPRAHEHDAEHAVRAGLALVETVPKLTTAAGVPLQVRVGIATGLVVVGDLIGAGAAQEQAVVGERSNLAARLQALAEPDAVVIADGTRRLLGNLFELKDLGTRDLKGIAGPARAWAALRASSVGSRFDALHTNCCFGAGPGQRRVKARWCCSPARQVSGNRGSRRHFWNASPANRTRACAISARRSARTALSTRSSARWNAPPDWRTTTNRRRSSTSSMRCSHRPRPRLRMPRSSPRCCRCRTMDAIPRSTWP